MDYSFMCLLVLALFAMLAESFGYGYGGGSRRSRGRGYFNKDPCELTLGMQYNKHPNYRHIRTIPSSCEKGHIDWHYPRGRVSLDFSDYWGASPPFTICLEEQGSAATQNITDVTDGYYPTKYNFQRPDQWSDGHVCIPSHSSRLRLVLDGGPRVTYYMTRLYYTKEDQDYGVSTTTGTTIPTSEPESEGQTTQEPSTRWTSKGGSKKGSKGGSQGRSKKGSKGDSDSYDRNLPKA